MAESKIVFTILRTDGSQEDLDYKPTLQQLYVSLGCSYIDVVELPKQRRFLIVDDEGILENKPINEEATKLYHQNYDTAMPIVGDVAIMRLSDIKEE